MVYGYVGFRGWKEPQGRNLKKGPQVETLASGRSQGSVDGFDPVNAMEQ